jgi:hypothetical protein
MMNEKKLIEQLDVYKDRVNLLIDIVKESDIICKDVDQGRYGDALMHVQKYWAQIEKLRQFEEKQNG